MKTTSLHYLRQVYFIPITSFLISSKFRISSRFSRHRAKLLIKPANKALTLQQNPIHRLYNLNLLFNHIKYSNQHLFIIDKYGLIAEASSYITYSVKSNNLLRIALINETKNLG